MGDPGGIGPEVIVKALGDRALRSAAHYRIFGVESALHDAAHRASIEPFWWSVEADEGLVASAMGQDVVLVRSGVGDGFTRAPNKRSGELSFRFVELAIRDALRMPDDALRADAIVTGPISKKAWSLAGRGKFPGHTELLSARFSAKRCAMMFESPRLRVVLVTAHLPLMDVRNVLTIGRVHDAIDLGHEACVRMGIERPRVGVCGLNPHAGEGGEMGDEEIRVIEPAIAVAQEAGLDVRGAFPGDTIFTRAVGGEFDLVVAMYHDQGLIPIKLLGFESAVNVTLGLSAHGRAAVRTSPDHGTAFDIAGRSAADPGSMREAIRLAHRLVGG